jgi:hypothetical protein
VHAYGGINPKRVDRSRLILGHGDDAKILERLQIKPTRVHQQGFIVHSDTGGLEMQATLNGDGNHLVFKRLQNLLHGLKPGYIGSNGNPHEDLLLNAEHIAAFQSGWELNATNVSITS